MDILPLHIEYLLTRHDCVIVPGIGAFIATETEAFIDLENGVIRPRCREISFNSSVVTDDGLLSHSIARLEGLSYEDARRIVSALIERLTSELNDEGEASLGMVGRLVKDAEGLISFQPRFSSAFSDLNPEIKLTEKIAEPANSADEMGVPATEVSETIDEDVRIVKVPADRYVFTISKRAVHAAAMLITILTIGLSLMIPINHDNEQKASVISIEEFFHHKVNADGLEKSTPINLSTEKIDSIDIIKLSTIR
ncbi:MAG: hypothetical protein K2N35_16145 [Muribaculaceae bacterium]|nr:hypothetical protein [Muribaculaceae bacterium]